MKENVLGKKGPRTRADGAPAVGRGEEAVGNGAGESAPRGTRRAPRLQKRKRVESIASGANFAGAGDKRILRRSAPGKARPRVAVDDADGQEQQRAGGPPKRPGPSNGREAEMPWSNAAACGR